MANEKIIAKKQEEVSKLAEKIKNAKLVILTDYRGITVEDVTKLRADFRKSNSEYSVIKNNIIRRALAECKIEGLDDVLVGPTAILMDDNDYLAPSKTLYNYIKKNDFYKIKGAILEGKEKIEKLLEEIDALTVKELAELVKGIEEKYGVSAVAAAAPAAGGAAAAAEEKSDFNILLKEVGGNKIAVIKVVRDVTGLGLKEAKEMVDGAPKVVKEKVAKAEAEEIKAKFVEAGAVVELQ